MDTRKQLETLDSITLIPIIQRAIGSETIDLGEWSFQEIQGGGGEGLGIYRCLGQAIDRGTPIQWSLILKVLGRPEQGGDVSAWNYWKREADAYQSGFLNDLPAEVKSPRCFGIV